MRLPLVLLAFLSAASAQPAVWDVWVATGQSNARGRGQAEASTPPPPRTAVEVLPSGRVVPLVDPVHGAGTGSMWPAFTRAYVAATGRGVVFIQAAHGGSCLTDACADGTERGRWRPDHPESLYPQALARTALALDAARTALPGTEVRLGGWVWVQGEADAGRGVAGEAYRDALSAFLLRAEADLAELAAGDRPEVLVVQTGRRQSGDTPEWAAIREAQAAAAGHRLASRAAVTFADRGMMGDEVHWNQAGLDVVGAEVGAFAADRLLRLGEWLAGGLAEAWPNPARTRVTVSGVGPIVAVDVLGRTIPLGEASTLDVSGLAPGVYLLRRGIRTLRITVVR